MAEAAESHGVPHDDLVRWLEQSLERGAVATIADGAPLRALRAVPESVSVSGVALRISADLWRDFMPICPPGGRPLVARVRVGTSAQAPLPPVRAERIAVISGGRAWITSAVEEVGGSRSHLQAVAREGPTWGPGILVDVLVELRDADGQKCLIRAADAEIKRSD